VRGRHAPAAPLPRPSATPGRGASRPARLEVGALLTYLSEPSEEPTDGACAAIGIGRPWLFLLDASGRYLAPAILTDECGLPLGWRGDQPAWETIPYDRRVLGPSEPADRASGRDASRARADGAGPAVLLMLRCGPTSGRPCC